MNDDKEFRWSTRLAQAGEQLLVAVVAQVVAMAVAGALLK